MPSMLRAVPTTISPDDYRHSKLPATKVSWYNQTQSEDLKEISKGHMVWCNPDFKAFGYEHPLEKEPTPAYPSDGSFIGEHIGIPTDSLAIGRNTWTNNEGVVVDFPTGSQPKRQIASSPDNPISEDSVRAHITKSQVMGQDCEAGVLVSPPPLLGCEISLNAEGETNPNYALSPGIPLNKVYQPCQQSSVAPSPIEDKYHHPTSLGGFLNVNCYGPMAYVGVPSQGSSPELLDPFAFEDGLP
ncbi:hypothetical protein BY996DRAFT_6497522 [Phakopsora pachyrhizi]|uniref:Uncharacterized protein n=1 Tax=Phakopsora pachyrhizi TaxID=170000 RepID=A0AAV0BW66_PHAPC|nr:hypothetical protein BY996DRAFT_6497522 [Phakopsora pachyrhizi]CAH7690351.1 hypothetical protein PPACK8108_LOCUS25679 [Phakopsora pachyrhizi]